jgi:hypothetical protein
MRELEDPVMHQLLIEIQTLFSLLIQKGVFTIEEYENDKERVRKIIEDGLNPPTDPNGPTLKRIK